MSAAPRAFPVAAVILGFMWAAFKPVREFSGWESDAPISLKAALIALKVALIPLSIAIFAQCVSLTGQVINILAYLY